MSGPSRRERQALGERLREMRADARLSGRALAAATGLHFTTVSKIENGARAPSQDDIRAWCAACGTGDQVPDLIAALSHAETLYPEYSRQARAGLRRMQQAHAALYERTTVFRIYETTLVPGLFATAGYAAAVLRFWSGFLGLADDGVDPAVRARLARQRVLYFGGRRFSVVLEEQALRTRVGGTGVMAEQLARLLDAMSLPGVSIGIVPAAGARSAHTQGSFWIFDDSRVQVETVSAGLTITQPGEIALYASAFGLLKRSAVYGGDARRLVGRALRDLEAGPGGEA